MSDPSLAVREAAGATVGSFAENINPDFFEKHKTVMPVLLQVINGFLTEANPTQLDSSIQKMLYALDEFVKNLDYDIDLYLKDICTILVQYAVSTKFSRDVKYWALTALSTSCLTAEKKVEPYKKDLFGVLHGII